MFQLAYHRKPESWRDYQYGMATLGRHVAQESIRFGAAMSVAQSPSKKAWKEWLRAQRLAAGW